MIKKYSDLSKIGKAIIDELLNIDEKYRGNEGFEFNWGSSVMSFLHLLEISDGIDYLSALNIFYDKRRKEQTP